MKTLILYATKHGAAREIAEQLANLMNGAQIHDLKKPGIPAIEEFDCVIVGGSVYAGSVLKDAKEFVKKNAAALQKKKFGLFLSGMDAGSEKKFFAANFPQDILQAAKEAKLLGGIFDPKKAGTFERLIMKVVAKQAGYLNTISAEKVKLFAEVMKG